MSDPARADFRPATEGEREFLRTVTRGYDGFEEQIATCLVSEWDDGYLDIRAVDGAPVDLVRRPALGPFVETGFEGVVGLDCIFWVDMQGMLASVEVAPVGMGVISDRMSLIVEYARSKPENVTYRHT